MLDPAFPLTQTTGSKKGEQARRPEGRSVRFGVYLDLATRKALLKSAIDEGIPATRLVTHLIKDYLAKPKKRRGARR